MSSLAPEPIASPTSVAIMWWMDMRASDKEKWWEGRYMRCLSVVRGLEFRVDLLETKMGAAQGKIRSQQKCIDLLAGVLEQQLAQERVMIASH